MKTTCFSFWIIALCKYYKTAIKNGLLLSTNIIRPL